MHMEETEERGKEGSSWTTLKYFEDSSSSFVR